MSAPVELAFRARAARLVLRGGLVALLARRGECGARATAEALDAGAPEGQAG